jgi:hypothetical protein
MASLRLCPAGLLSPLETLENKLRRNLWFSGGPGQDIAVPP